MFFKFIFYVWFFELIVFEIVFLVLKEFYISEVVLYLIFIFYRCIYKFYFTLIFRLREGVKFDLILICMRMWFFICWSIYIFFLVGFWFNGFINILKKYIGWIFFFFLVFSICNKINMCYLFKIFLIDFKFLLYMYIKYYIYVFYFW